MIANEMQEKAQTQKNVSVWVSYEIAFWWLLQFYGLIKIKRRKKKFAGCFRPSGQVLFRGPQFSFLWGCLGWAVDLGKQLWCVVFQPEGMV